MQTYKNHVTTPQGWISVPPRTMTIMGVGLLALVAVGACGCGSGKKGIDTSDNLKQLSVALIKYHDDNHAWPDTLDQVKPLIGKEGPLGPIGHGKDYAALTANPLTGDNPGYEYVKPKDDAPSATTIMLYQLRGGKRDETLKVAFKDGSVRDAKSSP
ncbi:MAG: hypothetical protein ABSG86_08810 [Thermoguttaceae bacterium]|jgi:spermidine/putrescine-binding protein